MHFWIIYIFFYWKKKNVNLLLLLRCCSEWTKCMSMIFVWYFCNCMGKIYNSHANLYIYISFRFYLICVTFTTYLSIHAKDLNGLHQPFIWWKRAFNVKRYNFVHRPCAIGVYVYWCDEFTLIDWANGIWKWLESIP